MRERRVTSLKRLKRQIDTFFVYIMVNLEIAPGLVKDNLKQKIKEKGKGRGSGSSGASIAILEEDAMADELSH